MRAVIFDTETNGKAKSFAASMKEVDNWPRITQFAWGISDGETTFYKSYIIKPDGWTVPKEQFFIDNNMSTERCEAEGVPLRNVLLEFVADCSWADVLVAHNMAFDENVVGAELIRAGIIAKRKLKICTMQESTNFCQIPSHRGFKWPKLEELYKVLFGCNFEGAHDALDDIKATERCFWELVNRQIIVR